MLSLSAPSAARLSPMSLSHETSEAIRVARVLCILSMVSVHFWPGAGKILAAPVAPALHVFYLIVIDYLGRGSVPLLSVVSGVLLTVSFSRKGDPLDMVADKARVFLVPMVLWSAILLALFGLHALLTGSMAELPRTGMGWANALFAITAPPANLPLGFLRDVFLSAAAGIAGLTLYRRLPAAAVLLLLALVAVEVTTGGVLLLRPQILAFFVTGMLIALAGLTDLRPPWALVILLVAAEVGLRHGLGMRVGEGGAELALSYLARIAMSLLMWRLALDIRARGGRPYRLARFLEPDIFLIFCSHMIGVALAGLVARKAGITVTSAVYPLLFLAQFPLVTVLGLGLSRLGRRHAPAVLAVLTGRSPAPPAAPSSPRPSAAGAPPPLTLPGQDRGQDPAQDRGRAGGGSRPQARNDAKAGSAKAGRTKAARAPTRV